MDNIEIRFPILNEQNKFHHSQKQKKKTHVSEAFTFRYPHLLIDHIDLC